MIKEFELNVLPEELVDTETLKRAVARKISVRENLIGDFELLKKSIDARKALITYRIKVQLTVLEPERPSLEKVGEEKEIELEIEPVVEIVETQKYQDVRSATPVIVIGAGPAGLFASLKLIQKGFRPIIIERGNSVSERKKDLAQIIRQGEINTESNWCFGEGGAGTFSDGKLFTRSNKRGNISEVLDLFVEHGADKEIMIDAHPHIGTDRLSTITKSIRQTIETYGGEYHFNTKVIDLIVKDNKIKGVITEKGDKIESEIVVLATGHSARDIYYLFHEKNWALEAKLFAMGVRIEHPQELINQIQYHTPKYSQLLPPATYSVAHSTKDKARGVFSFCMCPGGMIIPASTGKEELVVNGMSNSLRNSPFANSGIVVNVKESDAKKFSEFGELAMLKLQEETEKNMFIAADKTMVAPAQRLTDFIKDRKSSALAPSSYLPGLLPSNMSNILPEFISTNLRDAFLHFGKTMKGFITSEANIIGLESRTSSPVRIPRDKDSLQHIQISGLYPCGEGSGYSGGITSSAIDGINIADKIAETYK
ncbi:MAG: FAD-dependent oxidoreductase [Bacteroidales bacterium]|nr:FAD-dependent oxidoreductase [Bacteroidales bacterium]